MRIIPSIRSLLFALVLLAMSVAAHAQIGVSISFAPPELPVYEQPLCPGEGYLWTPGYWAYAEDDYYWVPGTWVMAPEVGFLWTPAYWGWGGSGYVFHDGYWGEHVGFYGGISYGYGYNGDGYQGGRWDGGHFFYNRSVNNINVTNIHNVYNTTVINNTTVVNRVSYNGGSGGIGARPKPQEEAAAREKHIPAVAVQAQHEQAARTDPEQRAAVNHGKPAVAATPKPGDFKDRAAVPARQEGAPYTRFSKSAAVPPAENAPPARAENDATRPDRPASNNEQEAKRPLAASPNDQPESNRSESAPRAQTPAPSERSQPERTPPPDAPIPAAEKRHEPPKVEEKKHADPKPKRDEKPKQDEKPNRDDKAPQ